MGDLQLLPIQPEGFLLEDDGLFLPLSQSPLLSNPSPASISEECWQRAEDTTQGIIRKIQPTVESEELRKCVNEYVQGLVRGCLGGEVYPFGSVPLKTYLPDGDVDLTALSVQHVEDALANDVRAVLEREEQSKDADFEVRDVQYIHAEVKLIKCLVQNIVVDISFNQLGGLCTLCFLEQVDRLIGKNHLFKRSIILIKAWCYYESRILGAHHGLISTYALETMVLYIFHLFHPSLNGPLGVLYRFLDYYSKFDWDHFCISLNGPVSIASLPEIVVEPPDNDRGELLLDKEFLKKCTDMFSVPLRGLDTNSRSFLQKHLNIIDPLKENNNLGRSVSKGNSYRIRSAFTYGARKLGQILLLTVEDITDELNKFFMNTLDRHGSGQRPDVQASLQAFRANGSDPSSLKLAALEFVENKAVGTSLSVSYNSTMEETRSYPQGVLQGGISDSQLSRLQRKSNSGVGNEPQRCNAEFSSSLKVLERFGYIKDNCISGGRLVGDAEDHATSTISGPLVTIRTPECIPDSRELVTSPRREDGALPLKSSSRQCQGTDRQIVVRKESDASKFRTKQKFDSCGEGSVTYGQIDVPSISSPVETVNVPVSTTGSLGVLNTLSDLSGDYNNHFTSLVYAQWCHDSTLYGPFLHLPSSPSPPRNNYMIDTLQRPMQLRQNVFPHANANGAVSRPHFFPLYSPVRSGASFGVEDTTKQRGIGAFIPSATRWPYNERISPGRSPPPVHHAQMLRPYSDNNWQVAATEMSVPPVHQGQMFRPYHDSNWTVTTTEMSASRVPHRQFLRPLRDTNRTVMTINMSVPPGSHSQGLRPLYESDRAVTAAEMSMPRVPHSQLPRPRNSNWAVTTEMHFVAKGSHEPTQEQFPPLPTRARPAPPEAFQNNCSMSKASSHSEKVEFRSFKQLPEASKQQGSSSHSQGYSSHLTKPTTSRTRPVSDVKVEGSKMQGYHLEKDTDFPPLAVPVAHNSK